MADISSKTAAMNDPKKNAGGGVGFNLEMRRAMVDQLHRYLLERFADYVGEKAT